MKLEKLLTLSQFVKNQRQFLSDITGISEASDIESCNVDNWNSQSIFCLGRINKYTDFLESELSEQYIKNYIACTFISSALSRLYFIDGTNWIITVSKKSNTITVHEALHEEFKIETIHDLANATNGELTIKNVNI